MKLKHLIIFALIFCCFQNELLAQQKGIEVSQIFYKASDYQFDNRWQYLSTDLYLMNTSAMDNLLQSVFKSSQIKNIKSIFISAKLRGSILEGLEYPLYNFVKNNSNRVTIGNYDAVTIIKNMPLSGNDNISAEISVETVTPSVNAISSFVNIVSDKIKILSQNPTLLGAVNVLKDELTKISANSDKTYVFNSTIQIYKDINPDKKIYSIGVYLFHNSNTEYYPLVTNKLESLVTNGSVNINKLLLQSVMKDSNLPYPYIIVVNYKSKYVSELDSKAEITVSDVSERKKVMQSKYDSKEITSEIYGHERRLNEFLDKYANFYETIDKEYRYNKSEDVVNKIVSNYNILRKTRELTIANYSNDQVFTDCFLKHYNDIVKEASTLFNSHEELQNKLNEGSAAVFVSQTSNDNEPYLQTYGTIQIEHNSNNPYIVYVDGQEVGEMSHKGTFTIKVAPGIHQIYVEQKSGFILYPTKGSKTIDVKNMHTVVLTGTADAFNGYFK